MKSKVLNRMRQRRNSRELDRTMHDASPAMRHELMAMVARNQYIR